VGLQTHFNIPLLLLYHSINSKNLKELTWKFVNFKSGSFRSPWSVFKRSTTTTIHLLFYVQNSTKKNLIELYFPATTTLEIILIAFNSKRTKFCLFPFFSFFYSL
jgi:hypothetical protein